MLDQGPDPRCVDEDGYRGTVVTLEDPRGVHEVTDGLEPFATRLFNHWGVRRCRAMTASCCWFCVGDREVAGSNWAQGYRGGADLIAQDIVNNLMLPEFRVGPPVCRDPQRNAGRDRRNRPTRRRW